MRILIDLIASSNTEHIRVVEELQKHHKILYWINMEGTVAIDKPTFPNTIFHNYHDAVKNISPKDINVSAFQPWGTDEITALSKWEMTFLIMMDKFYPYWSVTKRYDFYYDLLRYWGGVLGELKPDCIIFNGPPHQMYNLVLYTIAKHRGIKTILFDVTFRLDRITLYEDFTVGNKTVAKERESGFGGPAVSLEDLAPHVREHYNQVSGSEKPSPHHFAYFKKEHSPVRELVRRTKALWPFLKDGSIYERAVARLFKILKSNSKDEYAKYTKPVNLGKPYVYVPLNYQPECTTSPLGDIFVDQVLMIKMLSAALPDGWEIYVKEHPAQWPAHLGDFTPQRYRGFYADIAAVPHVRLVPVGVNTFELADHARATATVSGTAGWESIVRGKCSLIFGYPWFMNAPGIFRVSSVSGCHEALVRIASGEKPDIGQLFKYLACLDAVSFWGFLDALAHRPKTYDVEKEWSDMYHALERALSDAGK